MKKKNSFVPILILVIMVALILTVVYLLYDKYTTSKTNGQSTGNREIVSSKEEVKTEEKPNITPKVDVEEKYKNINYSDSTYINVGAVDFIVTDVGNVHVTYYNEETKERHKREITIPNETVKYIESMPIVQQIDSVAVVALTNSGNLYAIDKLITSDLGPNPQFTKKESINKIASNILKISVNTNTKVPGISFVGTFINIYALTNEGNLLSINKLYSDGKYTYVTGLPFEECNNVVYSCGNLDGVIQINKEGYIRDYNNIELHYMLDDKNQKIKAKYQFADYLISEDNRIYKLGGEKLELANNKVVKEATYKNYIVTVTYIDGSTQTHNINPSNSEYINKTEYTYGL